MCFLHIVAIDNLREASDVQGQCIECTRCLSCSELNQGRAGKTKSDEGLHDELLWQRSESFSLGHSSYGLSTFFIQNSFGLSIE